MTQDKDLIRKETCVRVRLNNSGGSAAAQATIQPEQLLSVAHHWQSDYE